MIGICNIDKLNQRTSINHASRKHDRSATYCLNAKFCLNINRSPSKFQITLIHTDADKDFQTTYKEILWLEHFLYKNVT